MLIFRFNHNLSDYYVVRSHESRENTKQKALLKVYTHFEKENTKWESHAQLDVLICLFNRLVHEHCTKFDEIWLTNFTLKYFPLFECIFKGY